MTGLPFNPEHAATDATQVAQAVCSASRAALLTGCYPVRVSILGALSPESKTGISDKEILLPRY